MNWQVILAIPKILVVVIEVMKAVEQAFPEPGQGPTKLAMVRSVLESLLDTSNLLGNQFKDVWPVLETVIGGLVTTFNSTGVFKK